MDKKERNRAIQAEIERRAAESGVPTELRVYAAMQHFSDNGGPRSFVPLKEMRSTTDDRDRSLWPTLFRLAVEEGVPIEFGLDDARIYRDGRIPPADLCEWSPWEDGILILSERANAVLEPFLQKACMKVPVTCATSKIFGYHLLAVEDVLDMSKPLGSWSNSMPKYSFRTAQLGRSPIFRIPNHRTEVFLLQPLVDIIEQYQLTGFHYRRVWPHTTVSVVVRIDVKKLPRSVTVKQPKPRLSTTAEKIETDFLVELLGLPRSGARKDVRLTAYRLPELKLPSGAVVAADLLLGEGKPFARRFTPGAYPLTLVAAKLRGNVEQIAFAIIQFSNRPVSIWEVAAIEGIVGNAPNDEENGYGVDSGTGGFCDPATQEVLLDLADPEGTWMKRIEKEMKKTHRANREWVHVETATGSAAIFSSGDGDGEYQSYFCLDEFGEPVALITDFGVVSWSRRPD